MSPFGLITAACIVAGGISIAASANAGETCDTLSEVVQTTAEARDAGVPKRAVMAIVEDNEPAVADLLTRIVDQVYSNDLPAVALSAVMQSTCERALE